MATTSKQVAARLGDRFAGSAQADYFRFNVGKGLEDTKLSDWMKASSISAHTRNYLSDNQKEISKCAETFRDRRSTVETAQSGSVADPPKKGILVYADQACHYIPLPDNQQFVGRAPLLADLKDRLFGDNSGERVAIVGLGGVGKTQVALHIAYWLRQNKPGWSVFWVPAQSSASFDQACQNIAQLLKLDFHTGASSNDTKDMFREYLESDESGRWLLIIDNADDDAVVPQNEELLVRTAADRGRILITTRSQRIATRFARSNVIEVNQMSESEALGLLERALIDKALLDDEARVKSLLEALTHLPLAIAQAAAYINETRASIAEYVRLLENTDRDMEELLSTEFTDETRYRESSNAIASTWVVSFEQIRKDADAAAVLFFIAYVEPKAIPRSMIPELGSEQRKTRALGLLCSYSFLTRRDSGTAYDMHRLVHVASRLWMEQRDDADKRRQEALSHLATIFDTSGWEHRETWQLYLPHVLKAIESSPSDRQWNRHECMLGHVAGRYLMEHGRTRKAVAALARVAEARRKELRQDDPDRRSSQLKLAQAYEADGRLKDAVQLLEHEVAIREGILPLEHFSLLHSQAILSRAYRNDGRIQDAIQLMEHVVAIQKGALPPDPLDHLKMQHELAVTYLEGRRIKEAIQLLEQVVAARERTLPQEHPDRLGAQHDLAIAYQLNGRLKDAAELLEHVVGIREEILPAESHYRLISQYQLGKVYRDEGRLKESTQLLEHVVAIRRETLSEDNHLLLGSQSALARSYYVDGRLEDALPLLHDTVSIYQKAFAEENPNRLRAEKWLACVLYDNKQTEQAIALLERVVAVQRRSLPQDDVDRKKSEATGIHVQFVTTIFPIQGE